MTAPEFPPLPMKCWFQRCRTYSSFTVTMQSSRNTHYHVCYPHLMGLLYTSNRMTEIGMMPCDDSIRLAKLGYNLREKRLERVLRELS
jgi:hypothetical protein